MHIYLHSNIFGNADNVAKVVKEAMAVGKDAVICCKDQGESIQTLQSYFPGAMFELVHDWGLRVWFRSQRNN